MGPRLFAVTSEDGQLGVPDALGRAPPSSGPIRQTSSRGISPGHAQRTFQRSASFEVPCCNCEHHGSKNPQQQSAATRTNRSRLENLRFPLVLSERTASTRDADYVPPFLLEPDDWNLHKATIRRRVRVRVRRSLGDLARERRTSLRRTTQNHASWGCLGHRRASYSPLWGTPASPAGNSTILQRALQAPLFTEYRKPNRSLGVVS